MKKTLLLLTIGLVGLSGKKDADPKPDTCKFSTSPSANSVTYDANGRVATLITSVYIWNVNRSNSPTGINNLSFDAAGRLTRYTVDVGGQLQYAQTYRYAQDGILTEDAMVDDQGNIFNKVVAKPVGKVKSRTRYW